MLLYWRKNEKEETIARKKAEKEALDRAKAEEEAREAKRQSRKLNFLLTQTELYSHFIGKKIKTAEAEEKDEADGGDVEGAVGGTARGRGTPGMRAGDEERDALMMGAAGGGAGDMPDLDYDDGELR